MSSELQLIFPSKAQDLQQLTGRESSLALPVTSQAISPLSSINLTVDIASINLAPSRLTLADLIQTAVHSLLQTPRALPLRNGKWGGGGWGEWGDGGRRVCGWAPCLFGEHIQEVGGRKWPQGIWGGCLRFSDTFWAVLFLTLLQIANARTAVPAVHLDNSFILSFSFPHFRVF